MVLVVRYGVATISVMHGHPETLKQAGQRVRRIWFQKSQDEESRKDPTVCSCVCVGPDCDTPAPSYEERQVPAD